ncbi:hypothetical protein BS47DRAFT_966511 [Hydnum rufescens UP504]|uniref:Uncharacterized protein n=1 Tax=Hydnum rufescens UP504 TaxID=1448309 RepID=A0A9P6AWU4_9AGAM|nr:hypothetical protein BS47DRAFT_966511 [Hydnum rufescens UP504]
MASNIASSGHSDRFPLAASVRLSVFAFALASWVEGYSQLRQPVVSVGSIIDSPVSYAFGLEDIDGNEEGVVGRRWFSRWLHRKGRRPDDAERTILGILDVATALGILHVLRNRPMLPFLLAPLFTTIPLPRSSDVRASRWVAVLLTSVTLCLFREFERVAIARTIAAWNHYRDLRDGVYLGPVFVRGARLPRRAPARHVFDDEEEVDCMICSGQNDMSQSVTSLSSQVTGTDPDISIPSSSLSLGPLEAFCTVAPTKHVAHRECFMRWHSAYESQRRSPPAETLSLLPSFQSPREDDLRATSTRRADLRRARALLKSAGFVYLLAAMRPATSSPSTFRGSAHGDDRS